DARLERFLAATNETCTKHQQQDAGRLRDNLERRGPAGQIKRRQRKGDKRADAADRSTDREISERRNILILREGAERPSDHARQHFSELICASGSRTSHTIDRG